VVLCQLTLGLVLRRHMLRVLTSYTIESINPVCCSASLLCGNLRCGAYCTCAMAYDVFVVLLAAWRGCRESNVLRYFQSAITVRLQSLQLAAVLPFCLFAPALWCFCRGKDISGLGFIQVGFQSRYS
jgi:hypothetical protein